MKTCTAWSAIEGLSQESNSMAQEQRSDLIRHLRSCLACRQRALEVDPALLLVAIPPIETSEDDVSNIIDAVRWVMGETSAKNLRGGTMADVVFTGSSSRAAVSQASVELVFDNSEGRVGGRFAAYGEISVKREIGREGQSAYFLNGARVPQGRYSYYPY